MKIISVVGARPNFMKIAPLIRAINKYNTTARAKIQHFLVHTGQHYDQRMSENFLQELGIPQPDINLEIGSGSHAQQVGQTMIAFEKVLQNEKPDWVIVVGDVNATLACSVTAKKLCIKCCHIEAGLRSGDITMPEEINRLVTDRISDLLLTPDRISSENLRREGTPENKIVFVGNIMIDTLEYNRQKAAALSFEEIIKANAITPLSKGEVGVRLSPLFWRGAGDEASYGLITMHRPSNVDDKEVLQALTDWFINEASEKIPLIWAVHPRTVKQLQTFALWKKIVACKNILLLYPLAYLDMLKLNMGAKIMITDSGGLQEECCVLGTPFLALRWNTERPVTLLKNGGAGYLVGNNINKIRNDFAKIMNRKRTPKRPELWDGNTAQRCLNAILNYKT